MITAIVLICSLENPSTCYTTMYSKMFNKVEECKAVIAFNKLEEMFINTINGETYDLYDYRCIDWKSGMI